MSDDRDLCERLVDPRCDGALALRQEAAGEIARLRDVVSRKQVHVALLEHRMAALERRLCKDAPNDLAPRNKSTADDWPHAYIAQLEYKLAKSEVDNERMRGVLKQYACECSSPCRYPKDISSCGLNARWMLE